MTAALAPAVADRRYRYLGGFAARRFRAAVATSEFFHATGCIHEFLLTGEKRMTSGANADFNVLTRRAGVVNRATRADDVG
jgi:hypothetical protein